MNKQKILLSIVTLSLLTISSVSNFAWSGSTQPIEINAAIPGHQYNYGTTRPLNFLDKNERDKFLGLLKTHGYSQSNSPELYNEIEKVITAQKKHFQSTGDWRVPFIAGKSTYLPVLAPLQISREVFAKQKTLNGTLADNVMSFSSVNQPIPIAAAVYSGVDSAVPDANKAVERTLIMSSFYDAKASQIGTAGLYDSFENKNVRLRTAIDANYIINTVAKHEVITIETTRIISYKNPATGSRIETNIIAVPGEYALDMAIARDSIFKVEVFNPKRIRPVVGTLNHVRVCVNRNDVLGVSGCDVPAIDNKFEVTFPINGNVTLNGKFRVLPDPSHSSIPGGTDISIWRTEGLDPDTKTGSLEERPGLPAKTFFDYIQTIYDGITKKTVISFNIPRESAYFGNATLYQGSGTAPHEDQDKKLNWTITMSLEKDVNGTPVCDYLRSKDPKHTCLMPQNLALSTHELNSQNFSWTGLPQLSFVYGCLAKGTLVMTESGETTKIEEMNVGDIVKTDGINMMVSSLSTGWEKEPMYRLETQAEHSMLLTRTHPVFTKNKGILWASEISVGDEVITENGTTRVVRVSQENYDDYVYNLKLEPLREHEDFAQSHHQSFYANGLLVGDAVMQNKLHNKNNKKTVLSKEQALQAIAARWHKDYQHLLSKHNK